MDETEKLDFEKQLDEVSNYAEQMHRILFLDIRDTARIVVADRSPMNKRHFVRAVMAYIEGMTYRMKQIALCFSRLPREEITDAEKALLREVRFDLTQSGETKEKPYFLSTEENVRFAFKVTAKVFRVPFQLDTQSDGWKALQKIIKVRHRLMHPKTPQNLDISEEELSLAIQAAWWFATTSHELHLTSVIRLDYETEEMKKLNKP